MNEETPSQPVYRPYDRRQTITPGGVHADKLYLSFHRPVHRMFPQFNSCIVRDGRYYELRLCEGPEIREGQEFSGEGEMAHAAELEQLMDSLWLLGIRPSPRMMGSDQGAAQAHHLQDMRAIAFNKLDLPLPEKGKHFP